MTTVQRLKSTRMAPYIGLMQELTPEERHLVVMFLTEQEEPTTKRQVPAELKNLRGIGSRSGWAAAAQQAHLDGEDQLMATDVFEDETMEDWKW